MSICKSVLTIAVALSGIFLSGCSGGGVDATYGKVRGEGINGVGTFAELCRKNGHKVRISVRLNDRVGDWADTIVRFGPHPGPPDFAEAEWYQKWASQGHNRRILYVPRDFDSEPEFWSTILAAPPKTLDARYIADATTRRDEARKWSDELPPFAKNPPSSVEWYRDSSTKATPTTCSKLEGPWSDDVDAKKAAITRHYTPKADHDETVLLSGDGAPLAMSWRWNNGGQVLVIANGSFLLNEPLVHHERRKLAQHVLDWLNAGGPNLAFIEGRASAEKKDCPLDGTIWEIFCVEPVNRVLAQWLLFTLLLVLSLAPILGRPRSWTSEGDDRPVAHAEALGDLLGRVRDEASARSLLDTYRKWRNPGGGHS